MRTCPSTLGPSYCPGHRPQPPRQLRTGFRTSDHCSSDPKVCSCLPREAPATPGPSNPDRAWTHPAKLCQDQPQVRLRGTPGPRHSTKAALAIRAVSRAARTTTNEQNTQHSIRNPNLHRATGSDHCGAGYRVLLEMNGAAVPRASMLTTRGASPPTPGYALRP